MNNFLFCLSSRGLRPFLSLFFDIVLSIDYPRDLIFFFYNISCNTFALKLEYECLFVFIKGNLSFSTLSVNIFKQNQQQLASTLAILESLSVYLLK